MNVGRILELFVAMAAVAIALSVATANPLAAACLMQFSVLIILEHDSEKFRSLIDGYKTELIIVKLILLIVAFMSFL